MFLKTLCAARFILNLFQDLSRQLPKQTLRIMKLTAIILLSACLTASAIGHSQNVTLSFKDAPLEKVFKEIKKQSGYDIWYESKLLQNAKKVTIELKAGTLEEALKICFRDQPLIYSIVEKTIVVKQKQESPNEPATIVNEPPPLIDVKGRITNENSEPVAATVTVKGTNNATATDADGNFTLKAVDDNATLVITGVSIETREIKVGGKNDLAIVAKTKVTSLNEVIINKGYYTEKQKYSVGNVTKVSGDDIRKQPVANPLLALEGRVPGLFITQTTGVAGGAVDVRVQGQNSIRSGLDPLIIVDGIPYPSQMVYTFTDRSILGNNGGSSLAFVNPTDIESIEVLKDADATAIYGSRAANGAILITTKKGKAGKTKIEFEIQQGWGKVAHYMDMMNTRQYLNMRYEALINDGIDINTLSGTSSSYYDLKVWDTTRYANWQKTLIGGTAQYSNLNGSVSGGNSNIQYLFSGTWHRETTVFPGSSANESGTAHFNLNSSSNNQKFGFQLSTNYLVDENRLPSTDLTSTAVWTEPNAPAIYNVDGTLNWAANPANGRSTWTNPLVYTLYRDYKNITKNLISNSVISYKILPSLSLKSSFGYNNLQSDIFAPFPLTANRPENRPSATRTATYASKNMTSWIVEPQVVYHSKLGKGSIDGLIGSTFQKNNASSYTLNGFGYSSDLLLKDIASAASTSVSNSGSSIYKYNALFSHLGYTWNDKYIISLNGRRDGSSKFGTRSRFHNFSSVGLAWIFTQESFIKKTSSFLSFGKLRGSYGTTGNDQISDYSYLSQYFPTYSSVPYQNSPGLAPGGVFNPYLQWEETKKLQLGGNLGFAKNRVLIDVTYERNRSSNLLLPYRLPGITGTDAIITNFPATIENTSWEITLNTTNVNTKNFTWTSSVNLTIPKNKLIAFPDLATSSYSSALIVGQSVSIIKVFHFLGVDPATGVYLVADSHGMPTTSPGTNDQTTPISTLPKYYGGFQNNITLGRIQIDFLFQYVKQIGTDYIFNNGSDLIPGQFVVKSSNQPVTVLNRWTKPGDNARVMRFNSDGSFDSFYNVLNSDANYSNSSFIRLKNLSVSWEIARSWIQKIRMERCRLFVQGQNLLTITKYKGLDPENQSVTSLPPLRVITVGLHAGF